MSNDFVPGTSERYDEGPLLDEKPKPLTEQQRAELAYPYHTPSTARANYRAGRELWDTNGDMW